MQLVDMTYVVTGGNMDFPLYPFSLTLKCKLKDPLLHPVFYSKFRLISFLIGHIGHMFDLLGRAPLALCF